MKNIFKFLKSKYIKAKLIKGGTQVKVSIGNVDAQETMTLLFLQIKQIAISMGVEPRYLMNKVIDLDKQIVKTKKHEEKEQRYQK